MTPDRTIILYTCTTCACILEIVHVFPDPEVGIYMYIDMYQGTLLRQVHVHIHVYIHVYYTCTCALDKLKELDDASRKKE